MQTLLREESLKAGDSASKATEDSLADFEKQMKDKGMQVVEIDVTPFRTATAPVYEKLGYGDLQKQVEALLKQ